MPRLHRTHRERIAFRLRNLRSFLTELGRDFCFVGSQNPVQVGNQDFSIDLVFFHRGLQCLVAFELKVELDHDVFGNLGKITNDPTAASGSGEPILTRCTLAGRRSLSAPAGSTVFAGEGA